MFKKFVHSSPLLLILTVSLFAASYHFFTINPFSSVETSARGVNDQGSIVGDYATASQESAGTESGYLFTEGHFIPINYPGATDTDANGISSNGMIVGNFDYRGITNVPDGDHGYILSKKGFIALPDPFDSTTSLPIGDGFPDFNGINEKGAVVGVISGIPNTNGNRGFVLQGGIYTVLDCGKDQTEANGIDNDGNIVGECTDQYPNPYFEHAFYWDDETQLYTVFDFPGAAGTVAKGISDDGKTIVGTYTDSLGADHGFKVTGLLTNPKFTTVDRPAASDTTLNGVNDHGTVVGTATDVNGVDTGFRGKKD